MRPESENYQGFYQQLFELSDDAHLIIENNIFVDCNQATVKMLGYGDKAEFLKKHPAELSPVFQFDGRGSAEKADEMMAIVRANGSHRFQWEHQRANGDIFPVEVLLTMLVSKEGHEEIHTVWRDITERRKRERELEQSESKFRSYLENAPLGIFISNRNGRIINVNPEAARLAGVSLEALRKEDISALTSSRNLQVVRTHLKTVLKKGKSSEDLIYIDQQGGRHYWSVSSVKHGDDQFISFISDTTERRRIVQLHADLKDLANEILAAVTPNDMAKTAARYLRSYFQSDAISIWYHDHESHRSRSLYVEDTPLNAQEPCEFPPEEFPLGADIRPGEAPRVTAYVKNRTEEEIRETRGILLTGDDNRVSASILSAPIFWEGEKIGVITVHSYHLNFYSDEQLGDLQLFATLVGTALQRVIAYMRLNESLAEKEILLQELQHRTRNNMNVIISLLNMQSHESRNEQLITEFKTIEERIFAMSTAYNKLQQGQSLNIINLRSYLLTLAKSLYHNAAITAHDVKLVIDLDEIFISLEQAVPIGLVFNEMMSNACKHAFPDRRKGSIRIALKHRGGEQIWLSVADDGIGVSDEPVADSGRGLGLRIIEMLIKDQLNGEHRLQVKPGYIHEVSFERSALHREPLQALQ